MFFSKYFTFISSEESLKGIKIHCGLQSSSELSDNPSWCLQFVQGLIIWFYLKVDLLYKWTFTVSDYPVHKTTWPQKQKISVVLPELLPSAFLSVQLHELFLGLLYVVILYMKNQQMYIPRRKGQDAEDLK